MFDSDQWLEVFATLKRHKLRTFMTAFGVFWGIFMLVLMLGFGSGLKAGVERNIVGFATNSVYVWGQRTREPYEGRKPGRSIRLTVADIDLIRQNAPHVDLIAPRIPLGGLGQGITIVRNERSAQFGVTGDFPALAKVESIFPARGRFLNQADIDQKRKVAVIGERVRHGLFGPREQPLGQYVLIRGVAFRVVGVVNSNKPGDAGNQENSSLFVPFTTFQSVFRAQDTVGWFALTALPEFDAADLEEEVRALLLARHGAAPWDKQALGSFNAAKEFGHVQKLFEGVNWFIWFVGIATLAAGILGVSNIMLISVKERTNEIGVRKALGATPTSLVGLVVQEAIVLTLMAGYVGLVAGVAALELASRLLVGDGTGTLAAPSIGFGAALTATLVLVLAGVVSGLGPARHAARIHVVEALRG